jgi:hypothetical protein
MISPFFGRIGGISSGALRGVPWWAVMILLAIILLFAWLFLKDND